jgi:hypothetical protein
VAAKSTQQLIDDVTKRLAETNQEIDALELVGPPTSNLEAEEANALKRMARREALHRVSSALSAELAELNAKLAAEKEEERRAKEVKVRSDIEVEKAKTIDGLWAAYQLAQPWVQLNKDLDKLSPQFLPRQDAAEFASRILHMLQELDAVRVTTDIAHQVESVVRIQAVKA